MTAQSFVCNICSTRTTADASVICSRETPSCAACGSNLRYRTIINGLSLAFFRSSRSLHSFPKRKDLHGIGLSDSNLYAESLNSIFSYTNTFFHAEPRLDIANLNHVNAPTLDFLIASDVFEHVRPPIERAFANARKLLRCNGVFFFSVPYTPTGTTQEHFPELFDFRIIGQGSRRRLLNVCRDGRVQVFDDLIFHGGAGATLEMRAFALPDLTRRFVEAGFEEPRILNDYVPEFGIDWRNEHCSVPMVARAH